MFEETTTEPERRGPTPAEHCEAMAAQGDLLGLLDFLETEASPSLLQDSLGLIGSCIRTRARADLSGLSEDVFARVLGMATLLLIKVQLYIMARMREDDQVGADALSGMPKDLTSEGWLDRLERLSRFVAEMAATRARVTHLNGISDEATRPRRPRRRSRAAATLAEDRAEVAGRKKPSRNGRVRRQAAAAGLSDRLGCALPRPQRGSLPPQVDLLGAAGTSAEGVEADPGLADCSRLA